ncbi:MAG: outer membrane beta-barrel family protein [Muribaculum sp.]|nr:outer membrane beta-barrel family protein [Muribaculum sp.]
MSRYICLAILSVSTLFAWADEPADTTSTVDLQEIVVEAPKVIHKADMDVLYPSQSAVENAKNGMQLLRNLMIPTVTVTEALESIKSAGKEVQIRINGRVASVEQLKNLLPETIKRVEWIDNPGLRYNGANAVLNFIVVNPDAGGSLMTSAMPALNCAFGHYRGALKLNHGRSQWGISTSYKLTNRIDAHRDYSETFTFPDGTELKRIETPEGGSINNTFGNLQLDYSYIKPDTTVFWVALSGFRLWSNSMQTNGIMTVNNSESHIRIFDSNGDHGFTPSMTAYFEQHFSGDQLIAVDLNGSMYNGRTSRIYTEHKATEGTLITDVNTSIHDSNKAFGFEADYIKNWKSSRLTAGLSYSANRNRSVYDNLNEEVFHQRQDRVYFFGEYFQRIKKVTLTAGIGAQYTSFVFKETGQGNDTWNVRPQFTVTYSPRQSAQFRLSFTSWQSAPSLSETNIAPQQIDGFQWRVGNPDLKTSSSYMLTLRYSYTLPRVNGDFGIRAFTSPDAITPRLYWDNGRLITTYENSRGLDNISVWIAPQIDVIPKWLTVSGYLQYRVERMRGTGYKLYNHNWSGHAVAMLSHWGFTLSAQYIRAQHDLWGQTISWGESISLVDLTYNWKKWSFSAGMIMPFGKYDQGSMSLNMWNRNEQHTRLDMRLPYIQIRYNLQWGRQKRSAQKLVNADSSVNTSTAAGR